MRTSLIRAIAHLEIRIERLLNNFGKLIGAKGKSRNRKPKSIHPTSPDFLNPLLIGVEEPNLSADSIQFLPVESLFTTVKDKVRFGGLSPLDTYFLDHQAASLCSKMADGWPRTLARKLNTGTEWEQMQTRYQLHSLAMKALNIYGPRAISFIIGLPTLSFGNRDATETRSYYHPRPDFPLFTFQSERGSFSIGFFLRRRYNHIANRDYVLDIRVLLENHETIGTINEWGHLQFKLEKYRPLLSVFIAQKDGRFRMYSGVSTGNCGICNRPLTNPDSLRIGIGPTCAARSGFDVRLYGSAAYR